MSKHRDLPSDRGLASDSQDDEREETATPDPWAEYVPLSITLIPRPANSFAYISFNRACITYNWLIDHWIKVQ